MILDIKKEDSTVIISYKKDVSHLNAKVEISFNFVEIKDNPVLMKRIENELWQKSCVHYYNSLEYSLNELICDLKLILKNYEGFTLKNYKYEGVYLTEDKPYMIKVGESKNVLKMPLSEFVKLLESLQSREETIKISQIRCELTNER